MLEDLDDLDWPEATKQMQRNWIGKSVGANVDFRIDGTDKIFTVFTTRCDTLFGATYCVMAPEHPYVAEITTLEQKEAIEAYKESCASKSDLERTELNKDKQVFLQERMQLILLMVRKFLSGFLIMY